uniref:Uncharacterized protein n=1 Tax=Tetranychus urticae TaxID=32264 RepID=T1JZN3_TETUR
MIHQPDDSSAFGCDYQENDLLASNDARPDDSSRRACDNFDYQKHDLLASNVNLDAAICNGETDKLSECQQVTLQTAKKRKIDEFIEKRWLMPIVEMET